MKIRRIYCLGIYFKSEQALKFKLNQDDNFRLCKITVSIAGNFSMLCDEVTQ
jgi:hypothetical protein